MATTRARAEEILARVRRIEISTRKIVETVLSGRYHTRFKGQGMQFSEFREYYPGDDIRHIDWKVTARTQAAHIRKFEEERDLTVYLIVDVSGSGVFGSGDKTRYDATAEVAALMAFAAVKNNDRVGLILFSGQVEKHIPPKKGRSHAMRVVTEILHREPRSETTDVAVALDFYYKVMKHSGVAFVVSDFYSPPFERSLRRLNRKHDVIGLRFRDPREASVPPLGFFEFADPETGEVFWADTSSYRFQQSISKEVSRFEQDLEARFTQAGADLLTLSTVEDYFSAVSKYFSARKRRR